MIETYAASEVLVNIDDKDMFEFAPDDMIEIEYPDDLVKTTIGADGKGSRTVMASRFIRVTLHLGQTSPCNDVLANLLAEDMFTKKRTFNFFCQDGLGTSVAQANEMYVTKMPKLGFKKDQEPRDWVMEAVSGDMFVGGNLVP